MAKACAINVRKVTATQLRGSMSNRLRQAKNNNVLLVENRRQPAKYVVDKEWLDTLVQERESTLATLEILADRDLTSRLVALAATIDDDVKNNRLYSMDEVFG
jgi:hypothetical protein